MHLIRILYAAAPNGKLVAVLDERYVTKKSTNESRAHSCQVSPSPCVQPNNTPVHQQRIRNEEACCTRLRGLITSEVLFYHVILGIYGLGQCSIPTFEGLLEEPHNRRLMKLIFRTAEWHSFAKLRVHTERTLDHLESRTKELGLLMRQFRDLTCSQFQTTELPREVAARNQQRRRTQVAQVSATGNTPALQSALASSSGATHRNTPMPETILAASTATSSRNLKTLNLATPKFHSLGDYVRTIQMFGCTDGFSTQVV